MFDVTLLIVGYEKVAEDLLLEVLKVYFYFILIFVQLAYALQDTTQRGSSMMRASQVVFASEQVESL